MVASQVSSPGHPTKLQPCQPDHPGQEVVAPQPSPSPVADVTDSANGMSRFFLRLHSKSHPVVAKALSLLVFIVSVVALWASISSAIEAQRATSLAEWTSKKDFLEFCENHEWDESCEHARNATLGAPPGFSLDKWRRWIAERDSSKRQHTILDTPKFDLHLTWLSIAFSSLGVALLLSHRRVKRKLLNLAKRYCVIIDLLELSKTLQCIPSPCRQRQESSLGDEEQCRGIDDLLDRSSIPQISSGGMEVTGKNAELLSVPTDEDMDLSAWAAEFEMPEEENDYFPKSRRELTELDWWAFNNPVDYMKTIPLGTVHAPSLYGISDELLACFDIDEQKVRDHPLRRAEYQRTLRKMDPLEDKAFLINDDTVDICTEEHYQREYLWEFEKNFGLVDIIRRRTKTRKRVIRKSQHLSALYHDDDYNDDRVDDIDYEDEGEDEYELEFQDEHEDDYEDGTEDAYKYSDAYDSMNDYEDSRENDWEDDYEQR